MDIYEAIKYLERLSDGAEIFYEVNDIMYIIVEKNRIRKYVEKVSEGYGIRVLKDKRIGFVSSNNLNKNLLDRVIKISKFSERSEFFEFPDKSSYKKVLTYDERFNYIGFDVLERYMLDVINVAKNLNVNISYAKIRIDKSFVKIINSNGVDLSRKESHIYLYVEAIYNNSSGFSMKESKFLDIDPIKVSYEACELAKSSSNPIYLDKKNVDVIFKPIALHEIFDELFLYSFSAENVQRGRSFLKDKIGKRVFSKGLDIYEDPLLHNGIYSCGFDDEGVPTSKKYLVKDGIVNNFLYNVYTAKKEGKNSTGNGFRSSYSSLPNIYPTNIVLEYKDKGIDYSNSLVVYGLMGIHTSNPVTGDFCVEVRNAFYEGRPVKKLLLYGNIFDMLRNIESVSKYSEQYGFLITPEIKVTFNTTSLV